MTQGDLVISMDQLLTKPRLGTCHKFYLHSFQLPNGESLSLSVYDVYYISKMRRELMRFKSLLILLKVVPFRDAIGTIWAVN